MKRVVPVHEILRDGPGISPSIKGVVGHRLKMPAMFILHLDPLTWWVALDC